MKYTIEITDRAMTVLKKYSKSSPVMAKKILKLLDDIAEHPREGIGKPETLKGYNGNVYSRRISGHDRIIYEIFETQIMVSVMSIGGHYDDK